MKPVAFDLADVPVMLCDVCKKALSSIRDRQAGTHIGERPQFFRHAPREDAWTGSHHVADYSFLDSYKRRCYVCYQVYQGCPRKLRTYVHLFRTFFEIESFGEERYSLRVTTELQRLGPTAEAQVIELHGRFKILPHTG
jgi:hypothetical protein